MSKVVVIGASGYIGTNLVPELLAAGHEVRAAARSREVLAARPWSGVDCVAADVMDPAALDRALVGQEVAYYLVHALRSGEHFADAERLAASNFAAAATRAGLRRIVYLGGLVPKSADSEHLRSRKMTGDLLRAGTVPVTEIRAGIIVGPGCASFEIIRDLVNHLPLMVTPKWVRSQSPPIALSNILTYLVRIADIGEAAGGIYDVAGPEVLTYEQLMLQYGEAVGKRPHILAVPVLTPRLSSYWLRLITAVPTSTARALIDGLELRIDADDREIRRLVPQRLLTYREAVAEVFEVEKRNAVAARWTEGVLMYRDYNPDYAFYAKQATGSFVARAPAAAVWRQVAAIGGENGYYAGTLLWEIRRVMDWAVGGPGRRRTRRHPTEVRVGDTIDFWRVVGVEEERRLTLAFGMRVPGAAILEFLVEPIDSQHTRITLTAHWHPAGAWGLAYWYAFAPSHGYIFHAMARAIAQRAEAASVNSAPPAG